MDKAGVGLAERGGVRPSAAAGAAGGALSAEVSGAGAAGG